MKIQNQVCTIAQAKRLKELGVKQDSHFSWFGDEEMRLVDNAKDGVAYSNWLFVAATEPANNQDTDWREDVSLKQIASAFTVAELGELLKGHQLPFYWNLWQEYCFKSGGQPKGYGTEASARAAMLIDLIENKIVHP